MNVLCVDDERLILNGTVKLLNGMTEITQVNGFQRVKDALEYTEEHAVDVAFLDINMPDMSGLELARRLKNLYPQMGIIFVTGYSEYAAKAFRVHANGYLMKPVTEAAVREELQNLKTMTGNREKGLLQVQTFGNFEVFCKGVPLAFERSRSKEIFAYLIDRQGTSATFGEIAALLWEDGLYDRSRQKQMQNCICDIKKTLAAADAEDVIIKSRKWIMVDKNKVDCDYYRFLEGDMAAVNAYAGKYMSAYSWAEMTTAFLDNRTLAL